MSLLLLFRPSQGEVIPVVQEDRNMAHPNPNINDQHGVIWIHNDSRSEGYGGSYGN